MKTNKKLIQIFLVSIGVLLIVATYLLYPKIEQNRLKGSVVENEILPSAEDEKIGSRFEELEFKGWLGRGGFGLVSLVGVPGRLELYS